MPELNGLEMNSIPTTPQVALDYDDASFVSSRSDVNRQPPEIIHDESSEDENQRPNDVERALKGYHIFFISVSGILGIGLYVRSANMLRLGGPGAVLVPFLVLGVLAWMVMQCISEMLLIWPISGALRLFVQKFVDEELGYAVSVAYWFTYSMTFAALISATAGEARMWSTVAEHDSVQAIVFFTLNWVVLLVFNMFSVRNYGRLEVLGGTLKLLFIFVVMVMMILINVGVGSCGYLGFKAYTESFFSHDTDQAGSVGQAFFMALQTAAFAFIGIEIPAVVAVEAEIMQPPNQEPEKFAGLKASPPFRLLRRLGSKFSLDNREPANAVLKFSAVYLPFCTACIYLVAGFLVTLNVPSSDRSLPSNGWDQKCRNDTTTLILCPNRPVNCTNSTSAFVISAYNAEISGLPDAITVFLILTALSSANTALYVASRTLYDLGKQIRVPGVGPWHVKWPRKVLSQFSKVGNRRVPHYALLASTAMFVWVPYLSLRSTSQNIEKLIFILGEMAAECCIMVWACECYAFIRFDRYMRMDENKIWINLKSAESSTEGMQYLQRKKDSYPYRSAGQPLLAWLALLMCMVILFGASGAALWDEKGSTSVEAIAGYLAPSCFVVLFILLKLNAYGLDFKAWFGQNPQGDFQIAVEQLNAERERERGRVSRKSLRSKITGQVLEREIMSPNMHEENT